MASLEAWPRCYTVRAGSKLQQGERNADAYARLAITLAALAAAPAAAAPILTQNFASATLGSQANSLFGTTRVDGGALINNISATVREGSNDYTIDSFAAWTAADRIANLRVDVGGLGLTRPTGFASLALDASVRNDGPNPVDLAFTFRPLSPTFVTVSERGFGRATLTLGRDGGPLTIMSVVLSNNGEVLTPGVFGTCAPSICIISPGVDYELPLLRLAPGESFAGKIVLGLGADVRLLTTTTTSSSSRFAGQLGFTGTEVIVPPPPPAPGALSLLGLGALAMAARRRRAR